MSVDSVATSSVRTVAELRKLIKWCIYSHQRILIMGVPGTGKTQTVNQVARELGPDVEFHTLIGSLSDPTDINGFPVQGGEVQDARGHTIPTVRFAPRDFLVRLKDKGGLLFLDELTSSSPSTLAALLRSAQDLVFGEFALDPTKVALVAAANPPDIAVNGNELGGPTINRYVEVQFPTGPEATKEWCEELPYNWGSPLDDLVFHGHRIPKSVRIQTRSWVANFIKRKPDNWLNFPKDEDARSRPWPSPRSWTNSADLIAAVVADGLKPEEALPLVMGAVGDGPATELAVMLQYADLPDPEEILLDPEKYKPSGKPDVDGAAMDSVLACVIARPTNARLLAACTVILVKGIGKGTMESVEVVMPAYKKLDSYISKTASSKDKVFTSDVYQQYNVMKTKVEAVVGAEQKKYLTKVKK